MSTICINGKKIEAPNGNISVINNKVYCNGKLISDIEKDFVEKEIKITIEGDAGNIQTDSGDVTVKGSCGTVETASGDVSVSGGVDGDVSTQSGDVKCGAVMHGNVKTMSGDITCGKVSGNVSSMSGDIGNAGKVSNFIGNFFG